VNQALSIRFFAHSWISDWNHGNAHFLRGLVRELVIAGHQVRCYEEIGAWSLSNLMREAAPLTIFTASIPSLTFSSTAVTRLYRPFSTANSRVPTW
jgi:spore maturation protein CgeB